MSNCGAECELHGWLLTCDLDGDHSDEHEGHTTVDVAGVETPILVWWGEDGHAFVGGDHAVDTGNIGGPRFPVLLGLLDTP